MLVEATEIGISYGRTFCYLTCYNDDLNQQKCRGGIQPRNHQAKPTMLAATLVPRGPETGVYSGRAGVDARHSADKHMT
jgi:hypothetical protein